MPRPIAILALLIAFSPGSLLAQPLDETRVSGVSSVRFHLSNSGIFGHNVEEMKAGFSAIGTYMYGSGLFFIARKLHADSLVKLGFWTYHPRYARSDATPGDRAAEAAGSPEDRAAAAKLYRSVDFDRATGVVLSNQSTSPKWPLWLAPGSVSTPMQPGTFVHDVAEREAGGDFIAPAFVAGPDEQFAARYHDARLERYVGGEEGLYGMPIGLQIQQHVFGWNWGPFKYVVVLKYDVVNYSEDDLIECAMGQIADIDIGVENNDDFGCYAQRPELRTAYGWTEKEWPVRPRSLLMIQLEGPVTGADGFIDNSRRHEYRENGRLGACRGWRMDMTPTRSRLYDFAADFVPQITPPGDILGMIGTRHFSMRPGDTAHYAMAFAVIDSRPDSSTWHTGIDSLVPLLIERYYNGFLPPASVREEEKQGNMRLTLLPSSDHHLHIRFSTGSRSDAVLRVYDMLGRKAAEVRRAMHDGEIAEEMIDMSASPAGVYVVELRSGGMRKILKVEVKGR